MLAILRPNRYIDHLGWLLVLSGWLWQCKPATDTPPSRPATTLKADRSTVFQLGIATLAKPTGLVGTSFSATVGSRPVTLTLDGDSLFFVMPDVPAGLQTLLFEAGTTAYKADYTVKETAADAATTQTLLTDLNAVLTQAETEQKITKNLPADSPLTAKNIATLRANYQQLVQTLQAASEADKRAVTKYLTANPDLLAGLRDLKNGRLRGDDCLMKREKLRKSFKWAIYSSFAGYVALNSGLPIGALIGGISYAVAATQLLRIPGLAFSVLFCHDIPTNNEPTFSARLASLTVVTGVPRSFTFNAQYRGIGREDATTIDPLIRSLLDLNKQILPFWNRLKALLSLEGNVPDFNTTPASMSGLAIPAADLTLGTPANATVRLTKQDKQGVQLTATFSTDSKTAVASSVPLSWNTGSGTRPIPFMVTVLPEKPVETANATEPTNYTTAFNGRQDTIFVKSGTFEGRDIRTLTVRGGQVIDFDYYGFYNSDAIKRVNDSTFTYAVPIRQGWGSIVLRRAGGVDKTVIISTTTQTYYLSGEYDINKADERAEYESLRLYIDTQVAERIASIDSRATNRRSWYYRIRVPRGTSTLELRGMATKLGSLRTIRNPWITYTLPGAARHEFEIFAGVGVKVAVYTDLR